MEIKKSYYAIIPAYVRYDENLTPNAKLLYGEISALCNEKGYCWATNQYFSNLYGKSITTISKWINQLKKQGYINIKVLYKTTSKEVDKRIITLKEKEIDIEDILRKVKVPLEEKFNRPLEEKLKDNNTYSNNTINNKKEIYKEKFLDCVLLAKEEHEKLIEKFGEQKTNDYIERVNNYVMSTGKKYRSHYHTILNWSKNEKPKQNYNKHSNVEIPDWLGKEIEAKQPTKEEQQRINNLTTKWDKKQVAAKQEIEDNPFADFGINYDKES